MNDLLSRWLARDVFPDAALRMGIRRLLRQRLREENRGGIEAQREHLMRLVRGLREAPIATETAAANDKSAPRGSGFGAAAADEWVGGGGERRARCRLLLFSATSSFVAAATASL